MSTPLRTHSGEQLRHNDRSAGRKIDRRLSGRDRMGPTIDHLVPLKDGGEHSYANVAAAHRSCNSRRGVSGAVQLALVG